MKRLVRGEKGYVLIAALLVLLVLGLISGPVLSYMVSGLRAGHIFETGAAELYAADAGVEDAVCRIQHGEVAVCAAQPIEPPYNISINGNNVTVYIEYDVDTGMFKINSIAVTADDGNTAAIDSSTGVEAYISPSFMNFSSLLDNAIVSDNSITIYNGVTVTGNVTSGGIVDDKTKGDVNGTITEGADLDWPDADDLKEFYWQDVKDGTHYDGDTDIDLEGNNCPPGPIYINDTENNNWPDGLGPLYVNGTLDITSSDQGQEVTLTLHDTLYITGDTLIGQTGEDFILDLNEQTIFVESDSASALTVGGKCSILGPGCIIAVGDIYFAPKGDVGSGDEYVLIMSVEGTTLLQPSGTFYGCVAGDLAADVKSGTDATIVNTGISWEGDINFPTGESDDPNKLPPVIGVSIESWEISRQ